MKRAYRLHYESVWHTRETRVCIWLDTLCDFARFILYMAYFARFPRHIPHPVVYVCVEYTTYCNIPHTHHNMLCLILCPPQYVDHNTHIATCIPRESSTHPHQIPFKTHTMPLYEAIAHTPSLHHWQYHSRTIDNTIDNHVVLCVCNCHTCVTKCTWSVWVMWQSLPSTMRDT